MKRKTNIFDSAITLNYIKSCEDFNEALEMALLRKGWRLSDLAKAMDYTLKHVSCVINNKTDMNLKFARRLSAATDLPSLFWIELYMNKYKDY